MVVFSETGMKKKAKLMFVHSSCATVVGHFSFANRAEHHFISAHFR